MSKRYLIPLLTVAAGLLTAAPAMATTQTSASENWAGYVVTPDRANDFSAVSGEWTEPSVKCTASGTDSYSAFWVGLGGGSEESSALEQIGTQADCSAQGSVTHYAWYELVPAGPVELKLTVKAGDKMYGRVSVSGDNVSLTISDRTSGQSWSKTLAMSGTAPDTSTAEWVAEAPSECAGGTDGDCTPLTLADFGTTKFSDAYATAGGHTGTISDSAWTATRMELTPSDSSLLGGAEGGYGGYGSFSDYSTDTASKGAAPTKLQSKGTSFSVKYGSSLTGISTTTTSGQGGSDGYGGDPGYGGYGYGGYGYGGYGYGGYGYGGYGGYGGYYGGGYGAYGF